jgi:hypothetical protein
MGLLGSILGSPVSGLMFILEKIRDEADRQLYDPDLWQQKLLDLQLRYEAGEIEPANYQEQEAVILNQLDLIYAMLDQSDYEDEEDEEEDE